MSKPQRISLQFSPNNEEQQKVFDLITEKGRKKSAFVTEAVMFYMQHNSSEVIYENRLKLSIRQVILDMIQSGDILLPPSQSTTGPQATEVSKAPDIDDEALDSFLDGLDAFDVDDY